MPKNSLKRSEILKSASSIADLFSSGNKLHVFPVMLVWRAVPTSPKRNLNKIAFSVSKRNFKRAVDRNRVKRLLREVYRQNKHLLESKLDHSGLRIEALLNYTGKKMPNYQQLEAKIIELLERLSLEE